MDNFFSRPEFSEVGRPAQNEEISGIITQTCRYMLGGKVKIADFILIHIPEYQFFHGPFHLLGRGLGGMFYFEDIKTGLLAVTEFPPSDMVKYSRFSAAVRFPGGSPYDNN